MALITLPSTPAFKATAFGIRANTQTFVSPLNRTVQTLELAGAAWHGSFTLPPMDVATVAAWRAAMAQLDGRANRFLARDPLNATPRGAANGSPQVDGAAQTGNTLNIDNWTIDIIGQLLAGDYLSFINANGRNELHIVTADADSDGSGLSAVAIEPPLRAAPADGTAITITNASCEMALVDDDQAQWTENDDKMFTLGFAGSEVFS